MKNVIFLITCFVIACNEKNPTKTESSLKDWILSNQEQIITTSNRIIKDYHNSNSNQRITFQEASIAITRDAPNILGDLAKKAGDSTGCILVELTFYKDENRKRQILLASESLTCHDKLDAVDLSIDSTSNFIFGKKKEPLYPED